MILVFKVLYTDRQYRILLNKVKPEKLGYLNTLSLIFNLRRVQKVYHD